MNPKIMFLYVLAGALSLIIIIYQIVVTYPNLNFGWIALTLAMSLFFFYLAYKTYHEKKDKELM